MGDDNHDTSRMDITGRCLAMCVGKPPHGYHPEGFYTGARVPHMGGLRGAHGGLMGGTWGAEGGTWGAEGAHGGAEGGT